MTTEEYRKSPKEVKIVFKRVTSNEEVKSLLNMVTNLIDVESTLQGGPLGVVDHGVEKDIGYFLITPVG